MLFQLICVMVLVIDNDTYIKLSNKIDKAILQ